MSRNVQRAADLVMTALRSADPHQRTKAGRCDARGIHTAATTAGRAAAWRKVSV